MPAAGMELSQLWGDRARAYRREAAPFVRYMAQSGFPAVMSLLFIAGSLGYIRLLHEMPPDLPVISIGLLVWTPVLCWNPLRTWLKEADIIYLMPRQHAMRAYMARAFIRAGWRGGLLIAAVLLLFVPIYTQGYGGADTAVPWRMQGEPTSAWLLALAVAALKAGNMAAGWQERKMAWRRARIAYRGLRWLLTVVCMAAWLTLPTLESSLFTVLCGLLTAACCRLARRQPFPWEKLIAEEAAARGRHYAFFGLFTDVPSVGVRISRRPHLTPLLGRIRYRQSNAYTFLYAASLLRAEIGGILTRLLLLGCLVTYWTAEDAALDGWAAVAVLALFCAVYGAQLGALRQINRYAVWKGIYPLPAKGRAEQYAKVDRAAYATGVLLLWLFLAVPLVLNGLWLPALASAAALAVYATMRRSRMARKLLADAEDD